MLIPTWRHRATRIVCALLVIACGRGALAQSAPAQAPRTGAEPAGTADQDQTRQKDEPQQTGDALPRLFFDVSVTTASRIDEEAKNTPQAVTVATLDAIERAQARTPNQMLREQPGIWSVQVASQGSPIIRGMMGNRVLYLWDGIRLNNGALFSGPNGFFNQFPVGAIEQMEVVRGPGAVQYGSDAIGGVVNIVQRKSDLFTNTMQVGGDVSARYGSVDAETTSYGNVWVSSNRFNLAGGVTEQNVGDYKVPGGDVMNSTGMKAGGGYLNLGIKVNDTDRLKFAWIHDRRFDVETYSQSKLNASGIPRIFGPFEQRGIGRVDYNSDRRHAAMQQLHVYAYDAYYTQARDQTVESAPAFNRTHTDTGQKMLGAGAQATAMVGKTRVVYGADARTEDLSSDRTLVTTTKATGLATTTVPNGNVPPGTYSVVDGFGMLRFSPTPRLAWSAGLRLESAKLHSEPRPEDALTPFTVATLTLDKRWNSVTWSTGAVYRIAGAWSVAGNIATGFRAPTFSDTLSTGVPVFASGVASVPSPGVDPERSITYEIGPRYDSAALNFSLTVYTNQLTDVLSSTPAGTINIPGVGVVQALQNGNISSAYVRGVETNFAYRIAKALTLVANATITRGQDTFANVPLRFVPPANGTIGLLWTNTPRGWWGEASVMIADRLRRHAPQDELDAGFSADPGFGSPSATNPALPGFQIPGWTVVNLRAGATVWKADNGGRQRVEVTVDLNNLLNERYREAYSQQQLYAPAFGVVFGTRVRF